MRADRRPGFVYVLTNPAYAGLVKIGHTARHPETRAAELSSGTGVPARFVVAWSHPVRDHEALEALAHGRLARCRANDNREFFSCTVAQARRIIEQEAAALLLPWWRAWLHRLAHPLPAPRSAGRLRPAWQRRQSSSGLPGLLCAMAGLVFGYVALCRPAWVPAWVFHQLGQLPHF